MEHVTLTRKRELIWVSPDKIVANDNNPRSAAAFTPEELVSLRRSIMRHGVLEPVIISPYKGDTYRLIEGERRWTSARLDGVKEIPAIVVNRMNATEELVTMFNVHMQRRSWDIVEQMAAIKHLIEVNPDKSDKELADELGMSQSRFTERRKVLEMGDEVVMAIARGDLDFTAALRAGDVSKTVATQRPKVAERLGGEQGVRRLLVSKVKTRPAGQGITRELDSVRQDARDVESVPDDVLEAYISKPDATLRDARAQARTLAERRAVEDLVKRIRSLSSDLRVFDVDLYAAPNLEDLRRALAGLIDTAQGIERRIVDVKVSARAAG
jgi:ParB/RepB/Spo0J family partition protein